MIIGLNDWRTNIWNLWLEPDFWIEACTCFNESTRRSKQTSVGQFSSTIGTRTDWSVEQYQDAQMFIRWIWKSEATSVTIAMNCMQQNWWNSDFFLPCLHLHVKSCRHLGQTFHALSWHLNNPSSFFTIIEWLIVHNSTFFTKSEWLIMTNLSLSEWLIMTNWSFWTISWHENGLIMDKRSFRMVKLPFGLWKFFTISSEWSTIPCLPGFLAPLGFPCRQHPVKS